MSAQCVDPCPDTSTGGNGVAGPLRGPDLESSAAIKVNGKGAELRVYHPRPDGGVRQVQSCSVTAAPQAGEAVQPLCHRLVRAYTNPLSRYCRNESAGETGLRQTQEDPTGKDQAIQPSASIHKISEKREVVRSRDVAMSISESYEEPTPYKHNTCGGCFLKQTTHRTMGGMADSKTPPSAGASPAKQIERWSSYILKRIWSLWGHMARGGAEVNSMVTWKNMQFWRAQQQLPRKQRVTHASRFNPEADVERAIEAVAGTHWGDVAQDRQKWQELSLVFLEKFDVPWPTGKQLTLQDNLLPHRRRGPPTHDAMTAE